MMYSIFDQENPKKKRKNSQDLSLMIQRDLARIGFDEAKILACGGQGKVLKVPVYFTDDTTTPSKVTTRWCVIKCIHEDLVKSGKLNNYEEDINKLLTEEDESSNIHHIIKLIAQADYNDISYALYPYCDLVLSDSFKNTTSNNRYAELSQKDPLLLLGFLIQLTRDLLVALDHMHKNGYVHRDIKLENIGYHLGKWCLFDLGLADELIALDSIPSGGPTVGTYTFMHPRSLGTPSFSRTRHNDIYSLGQVLHCLFSDTFYEKITRAQSSLPGVLNFALQEDKRYKKAQAIFPPEVTPFMQDFEALKGVNHYEGLTEQFAFVINKMKALDSREQPSIDELFAVLNNLELRLGIEMLSQDRELDDEIKIYTHSMILEKNAKSPASVHQSDHSFFELSSSEESYESEEMKVLNHG